MLTRFINQAHVKERSDNLVSVESGFVDRLNREVEAKNKKKKKVVRGVETEGREEEVGGQTFTVCIVHRHNSTMFEKEQGQYRD